MICCESVPVWARWWSRIWVKNSDFYQRVLGAVIALANADMTNATIFGYEVADPQAYGLVEFDRDGKAVSLEEKPRQPTSNYAVPRLYFYPDDLCERATALKPLLRGKSETTDLNRTYLNSGNLRVQKLGRGVAWLDTVTRG